MRAGHTFLRSSWCVATLAGVLLVAFMIFLFTAALGLSVIVHTFAFLSYWIHSSARLARTSSLVAFVGEGDELETRKRKFWLWLVIEQDLELLVSAAKRLKEEVDKCHCDGEWTLHGAELELQHLCQVGGVAAVEACNTSSAHAHLDEAVRSIGAKLLSSDRQHQLVLSAVRQVLECCECLPFSAALVQARLNEQELDTLKVWGCISEADCSRWIWTKSEQGNVLLVLELFAYRNDPQSDCLQTAMPEDPEQQSLHTGDPEPPSLSTGGSRAPVFP